MDAGLADRQHEIVKLRHFKGVTVEDFVFEEDDRVRVADRGLQQTLGVGCRIGHDDLEAGDMAVPVGIALRVLGSHAGSGTARAAEDDRRAHLATGHVERLGSGVDDLVDRLHGEVEGHELDDRAKTGHGSADADTGKAMLGDRGVNDATRTEFLQQALGDLVGALVLGDFFAHDENVVAQAHFFGHGVAKRFANGHRHHFGAGRDCRIGGNFNLRLSCNRSRRGRSRSLSGCRLRRFGLWSGDIACRFAVLQQHGDRRVDLDALGAGGNQELADRAFVDGFDFHRRLVRLDFSDDVAGRHLVSLVLQPFRERAFLHRRGKGGHKNFYWHVCPSPDQSRISV
ncbi:hypothetical protein D9M72_399890 [compost metagenome]